MHFFSFVQNGQDSAGVSHNILDGPYQVEESLGVPFDILNEGYRVGDGVRERVTLCDI